MKEINDNTGGTISSANSDEKHEWTVEELEKELANAVVASSKIDALTEALIAAKEGRLSWGSRSGSHKETPYGNIWRH